MIGFTTLTGFEKDPGRLKYLETSKAILQFCQITKHTSFRFCKTSPEVI